MNSLAPSSSSVGNEQKDPLHQKLTGDDGGTRISQSRLSTKLREWFLELLTGRNEDGFDDDDTIRHRRRRRLLILSILSIILGACVRSSRRRRQRASDSVALTSNTSASLWPVSLLMAWWKAPDYKQNPQQSTMNLLYSAAKEGIIQQALVGSNAIYFQTKRQNLPESKSKERQWNRTLLPPNNDSIRSSLLEALAAGGCDHVEAIPESIGSQLTTPILTALPFVYLALVYKMMKNQFGGDDISSKLTNGTRNIWGKEESDRTTFADVAGLPSAVEDMSEVVSYLSNPSLYTSMGARPPKGVLLHGPPGSGKTLLARAVAGEAMCDSFTALSGSAFVEMYVGRGAARVRALFQQARRDALRRRSLSRAASWWSSLLGFPSWKNASSLQERPACAIIFIDELDAVAKSRSYDGINGNDEREQTLNQLLTEMDGFDTGSSTENDNDKEDVTLIVIAASNRVDVIDPAVLRRFDRQIFVGYPDASGRKDILQVHARKIACASNVDLYQLSSDAYTSNFSGADLRNVVNEAALFAVRERSSVVEQTHLLHAARRISQMKTRTSAIPGRTAMPTFFTRID